MKGGSVPQPNSTKSYPMTAKQVKEQAELKRRISSQYGWLTELRDGWPGLDETQTKKERASTLRRIRTLKSKLITEV